MGFSIFTIKQKRLSKLAGLLCIFFILLSTTIGYAGALTSGEAPGAPGNPSWWAPTTNYFVGTANNSTSKVYFTGFQGIIGAVFWPTPDTPNTTDLQFMVGDAAHTWVDEEKVDTDHVVTLVDPRALIWKVTNTDKDGKYKIEKIIYTDPTRDSLIQEVTFTALTGTVGDYLVYVLYNPTISNSGDNDTGQTVVVNGKTYLQASDPNGRTSVLGTSIPFQSGMQSNGFVGVSDGWTDLKGGTAPDYTMNWTYDSATNGNVAQMALLDLGEPAATSVSFKVVLGFGATATDAQNATIGTLGSDFATLKSTYIQEWNTWCNSLDSLGGTADQQYYV
ncbi:hypothetical protein [Thermanaeromonas toyohensis]|uniref:hypothetical protein n=1 Tax=Thermanaeromonas toyohensis TaxID=161154 RepID=UPI000A023A07|nr:hypothetical protein [Thermanaeromonas toyohensis]